MFEQYQGPVRLLFEYKEATKHEREEIRTRKIPVALRGILSANVRAIIIKLYAFLNAISQKAIDPTSLIRLQQDVV